jgi:hypothetical protein
MYVYFEYENKKVISVHQRKYDSIHNDTYISRGPFQGSNLSDEMTTYLPAYMYKRFLSLTPMGE